MGVWISRRGRHGQRVREPPRVERTAAHPHPSDQSGMVTERYTVVPCRTSTSAPRGSESREQPRPTWSSQEAGGCGGGARAQHPGGGDAEERDGVVVHDVVEGSRSGTDEARRRRGSLPDQRRVASVRPASTGSCADRNARRSRACSAGHRKKEPRVERAQSSISAAHVTWMASGSTSAREGWRGMGAVRSAVPRALPPTQGS